MGASNGTSVPAMASYLIIRHSRCTSWFWLLLEFMGSYIFGVHITLPMAVHAFEVYMPCQEIKVNHRLPWCTKCAITDKLTATSSDLANTAYWKLTGSKGQHVVVRLGL